MTADEGLAVLIAAQALWQHEPQEREEWIDSMHADPHPQIVLDCCVCELVEIAAEALGIRLSDRALSVDGPIHTLMWEYIVNDANLQPLLDAAEEAA
jgi:hypothetical protein